MSDAKGPLEQILFAELIKDHAYLLEMRKALESGQTGLLKELIDHWIDEYESNLKKWGVDPET